MFAEAVRGRRSSAENFSPFSQVIFGTKSFVNTGRPSAIFAYWQITQLHGRRSRGAEGQVPPEFGAGWMLMQIVPPDFVI